MAWNHEEKVKNQFQLKSYITKRKSKTNFNSNRISQRESQKPISTQIIHHKEKVKNQFQLKSYIVPRKDDDTNELNFQLNMLSK
jgi:hypothetical protein